MTICLAAMPWQSLDCPSLPIGLLKAVTVATGRPEPLTYHGGIRWAEFLIEATDGDLGPSEYTEIAEEGLFHGLGDWVFAGVLHDDESFGIAQLRCYAEERGVDIERVVRMRAHAAAFVEAAAREIIATGPALVGFTTTFMQNAPSLATARRIKALAPQVPIVFGGGNCDGAMGAAIHANFPFVDYVVRGEGEVAFPALLDALDGRIDLAGVPGLSWRGPDGRHDNPQGPLVPPALMPMPDYDDWFQLIAESPVGEYVEPKLVLESARGCWWGEKHHCTFCGLNGTGMQFRAKPPQTVIEELTSLVRRHQTLDAIMVDNIIDNRYFRELLPSVAALDWDLRIHYEVKSNLRPDEIAVLRQAGVTHVQPGIESLVSPVLKLMDKGVTGVRNVRTLRDCEAASLTVSWNWLYGFPTESTADYEAVLRQLPALVHLQPPASAARILLERFSPYFENPLLGFPTRRPAKLYEHVYALAPDRLMDMVYLFDTDPAGLSDAEAEGLHKLIEVWIDAYPSSSLRILHADDQEIVLEDRRVGWPERDHRITGSGFVAAYRELENGRTAKALAARVAGYGLSADDVTDWLAGLAGNGLVFTEQSQWITVATSTEPLKVS
ncbi:RiPP maturation radical SAM C-methyltransferase [Verrucosispora sp. WMMD573]|uniref:RiPP maturation radical SAM C-methyltransferase n=1 Tax=Verrucosispora sp. WMMD573 TaxID=3015149 RepID=UPI00248D3734|nr:RiPP maturation radical SAM C-methyltransferase [Verrucosispora sp. WMMD573]WBB56661.1 RiPP maturation radical SAM C-methyltransferase [Verrucosispora sp. WMMD573]